MIRLPGLIDVHTHLRGLPSDNYKEDFTTATAAAIAGGFTTIIDMPNNPKAPTLTYKLLQEKQRIAKNKILCDVGFFFGTNGKNMNEFSNAVQGSMGLKIFLSFSTANLIVSPELFTQIIQTWPIDLPILLHAESDTIQKALDITEKSGHRVHICHVSSAFELQQIIAAKQKRKTVTCGVTPHHLFLTQEDEKKLGSFGLMKPMLKTHADVNFLWKHLADIDVIESDHAPHSREEKLSNNPPFGVPGLETTLGLLLTAAHQEKITIEEIKKLCYENPKKIFLSQAPQDDYTTYIEIDENEEWVVDQEKLFTKAKSSPFFNWKLKGIVKRVFIRGTKAFENGQILAKPGSGRIFKSIV